jgi:hypothetical protein
VSPSSLVAPLLFFFSCFVYLVCLLFGTLCGCRPWDFTQIIPSNSECVADLLRARFAAHRLLLVFSHIPLRCAFNAIFRVGFWPARDWLPLGCRHPHSLLSLFFLWFFFSYICLFFHCYLPIHFLLFVPFIWLFFHFLCFYFPIHFSFLFLLVIRLYSLKLFSAHEYICIWSKSLGCGCERYLGFGLRRMNI